MPHNIAIVGLGKIARDQHLPAIADNAAFQLAATASRNAALPDIPSYISLAELLEAEPDIPCVSLCTPPQVRFDDARRALNSGRHVMLEKPPGTTLSEVHALVRLAKEKGLTLFATWHSRHAAAVESTRNWLKDKAIREACITWKEDVRVWHPGQDWVWKAGGLGVFDPGINALSILTLVMPRSLHLVAADLYVPDNRDMPIAADLRFYDPGQAVVSATFDWRQTGDPTWAIRFTTAEATAVLSQGGALLTIDGVAQPSGPNREYPELYARFADLLAAGESDVDLSPLRHVADAFMLGRRITVEPFDW